VGEIEFDESEGIFAWWPIERVQDLEMPSANVNFFPHIIDIKHPFYQAKYVYDSEWQLLEIMVHSNQTTEK
jgi:hypothetical protein